ncbi:syndecan-1 [Rhineura floridana]|uniref:syndecan-1 n=1 Tax=Rhineura floridana TaxID=261503 RepID=UPI002AC8445A|nr:syndecan-1 [Rhineura floridana]
MVNVAGALCVLVFSFQAVLAQPTDSNLPPEDLDSSGDDYDSFSGSGAGSLPDHLAIDLNVPLLESMNTSLMPEVSTGLGDNQLVQQTDSPTEDYSGGPASPTSLHLVPLSDLVTDKAAVAAEDELDSLSEQATTRPPVITTRIPVTHHVSTVRITTSQVSSTLFVEPEVYHDVHRVPSIDDKTPALDFVPTSDRSLQTSPTTTSSVVHKEISSLPDEGILLTEEGSGNREDFTFNLHEENEVPNVVEYEPENTALDTGAKDAKSAGTSQGIMDRKEVLGGVIAGGLVGLLFAGFLVGFMLYRMKKKDEGSYSLDEPKQSNGGYQKPQKQEEFYA